MGAILTGREDVKLSDADVIINELLLTSLVT